MAARELLEQERRHAGGGRPRTEARVVTELLGQGVIHARSARHEHDAVAQALGLDPEQGRPLSNRIMSE